MLVTKEFLFDSAHFLPKYNGKCEKMHGHTYKLQVTVKSEVNQDDGLAYDFVKLKKIVMEDVIKIMDHNLINDIVEIPSAEFMVIWMWDKLKTKLPLYEIKLWETPTSFVTYNGE